MSDKEDQRPDPDLDGLESVSSEPAKSESVTFQIGSADREWLERFAFASGKRRTHPWAGGVTGNISWATNEAIRFLRANFAQYQAWQAAETAKAMGQDSGGE